MKLTIAIKKIEKFITALWDIGLEIGVSVRTNSECISEAKKDVTVCTNLIESRRLWGIEENILKLKKIFINQIQKIP